MLWVALEVPPATPRKRGQASVGDRTVAAARLWSPSPEQEALIRGDFELIVREYFRTGRADQLTGHIGRVLQVRPKARNNKDTRAAYDSQGRRVHIGKSGFYLRPAFVGDILRNA